MREYSHEKGYTVAASHEEAQEISGLQIYPKNFTIIGQEWEIEPIPIDKEGTAEIEAEDGPILVYIKRDKIVSWHYDLEIPIDAPKLTSMIGTVKDRRVYL